jgi:hypothetical protein
VFISMWFYADGGAGAKCFLGFVSTP